VNTVNVVNIVNIGKAVNIEKAGPRFAGRGPSKGKSDLVHFTRPSYRGPRPRIYDIHDIRDIHGLFGIHGT
jgi:hypothetical protein